MRSSTKHQRPSELVLTASEGSVEGSDLKDTHLLSKKNILKQAATPDAIWGSFTMYIFTVSELHMPCLCIFCL